ncbi:MAG: hypothetical protein Q7R47_01315 [Candidatus Diapherotrites archaeon]|nr:hypothetical protein [Candidatus Diapherotrites archaeon]
MVDSAKKHEPVRASKPPSQQRIIGADEDEPAALPLIFQNDPTLWTKCSHLKQHGGRDFCTQFVCLCAKVKCPPKVMKIDYSKIQPQGAPSVPALSNGHAVSVPIGNDPMDQSPLATIAPAATNELIANGSLLTNTNNAGLVNSALDGTKFL